MPGGHKSRPSRLWLRKKAGSLPVITWRIETELGNGSNVQMRLQFGGVDSNN